MLLRIWHLYWVLFKISRVKSIWNRLWHKMFLSSAAAPLGRGLRVCDWIVLCFYVNAAKPESVVTPAKLAVVNVRSNVHLLSLHSPIILWNCLNDWRRRLDYFTWRVKRLHWRLIQLLGQVERVMIGGSGGRLSIVRGRVLQIHVCDGVPRCISCSRSFYHFKFLFA